VARKSQFKTPFVFKASSAIKQRNNNINIEFTLQDISNPQKTKTFVYKLSMHHLAAERKLGGNVTL
jgi:hypothetical protein